MVVEPAVGVAAYLSKGLRGWWIRLDERKRRRASRFAIPTALLSAVLTVGLGLLTGAPTSGVLQTVLTVCAVVLGATAALVPLTWIELEEARAQAERLAATPTLADRIATLVESLNGAAAVIATVESEVQARRKLVHDLEQDAATYHELTRLSSSEVDAVAQTLRGELELSGRKSARASFVQNCVFFALGIAASVLTSVIVG